MTRKAIGKKVRFEVFKRDSFTCQYCGASAPDVVLQVDHIDPVSKGGEHSVMNFITSCQGCNAGKSDRLISDDSVIKRQKEQLDQLNERREQIEMMLKWREAMNDIDSYQVEVIAAEWKTMAIGYQLNAEGLRTVRKLLKKYGLPAVMDALSIIADQYLEFADDGRATVSSVGIAWGKLSGVLRVKAMPEEERRVYYCRAILRNRLNYCNEDRALIELRYAVRAGVSLDELQEVCREVRSWTDFINTVAALIEEQGD